MNRRLQNLAGQFLTDLARFAGSLASLVLVIDTSGCATGHPSPLLIEHPVPRVPETDPNKEATLKVVTYNIWGLPSWMTGARAGRYPKIAHELKRLDPDVVLLQEAWTAKSRKSAPASGEWSIARAAGQHTFFQQSGLVTLSRFPIIGGEFYPFSRSAFPDKFVNKGVLKVTVRLPGEQVINVWNVHLQDGGTREIRASQIHELITRVQAAEDGQIADLVGGDFNVTPDSEFYGDLARSLGPSVQQLSGKNPFVTWDGLSAKSDAGETLDYIFIKKRSPFQRVQAAPRVAFSARTFEQRLSDHLGIEAEVGLGAEPSLAGATHSLDPNARLQAIADGSVRYSGGE